jgi:bacterioferritin
MRTAIEEMEHIELLAERIIFLGGDVEMVASASVKKVQDVAEMLEMGIQMEQGSIRDYNLWANECSANADSGSKKIFERLVDDEERHYDQYDNEKNNLERFGDRYLALQSIEMSKSIASQLPTE